MYLLNDICSLCLVNGKTIRSIFSKDNNGTMVKRKVEYALSEINNFKSEILKNICIDCLKDLNFVCKFKQKCLQNLTSLNNYTEKVKVNNTELNSTPNTKMQDQMSTENHFIAQQNHIKSNEINNTIISDPTENQILVDYIKEEPNDIHNSVTFNDNYNFDEMGNAENNEKIEVVKTELEYCEINIKCEPLLLGDTVEKKSNPSKNLESVNNYTEKVKVNNEELNSASTSSGEQNQMTFGNHFLADHNYFENFVVKNINNLNPVENDILADYIQNEPVNEIVSIKDNSLYIEISFDTTENAEIKEGTEIVQKQAYSDSVNKYDPLLLDYSTEEKSKSSESTKNCSEFTTSTDNSKTKKKKKPNTNRTTYRMKRYRCKLCRKRFLREFHLILHSRVHTGERPYKCTICENTYAFEFHLVRHSLVHWGEERVVCDVCHKIFPTNNELLLHKRRHTNIRLFTCSICYKSYKKKCRVTELMQTQTGEKIFQCQICLQKAALTLNRIKTIS